MKESAAAAGAASAAAEKEDESAKAKANKTLPDKANETNNPTESLYDADASQIIPLEITKGARSYNVAHVLRPLSDERYFALDAELEEVSRRNENLSSALYEPKHRLWRELVEERIGYKERPDWREKTHQSDAVQAVNALLFAETAEGSDAPVFEELLDDEDLSVIALKARFSDREIETTHSFREETKAEFDRFVAIVTGAARREKLASMKKRNATRDLCELYDAVCAEQSGYAGRVPAWHKIVAVRAFFENQFSRLGKF